MGLLSDIIAHKQLEAATLPPSPPRSPRWDVRPVVDALRRGAHEPVRLIAEIKFRSPSAGPLCTELSVADRAATYEEAGATMLSILTDARWFDGAFEHLRMARTRVSVPLMCKDFIVDARQVDAAFRAGADAVLLIARCLPGESLGRLATAVRETGLVPFFEVVDDEELARCVDLGAEIIGVNARDLDTLAMDPERASRVLASIPRGIVAVHLSGVSLPEHVTRLRAGRADAALLGEALMRHVDPRPLLRSLIEGSQRKDSAPVVGGSKVDPSR